MLFYYCFIAIHLKHAHRMSWRTFYLHVIYLLSSNYIHICNCNITGKFCKWHPNHGIIHLMFDRLNIFMSAFLNLCLHLFYLILIYLNNGDQSRKNGSRREIKLKAIKGKMAEKSMIKCFINKKKAHCTGTENGVMRVWAIVSCCSLGGKWHTENSILIQ